MSKQKDSSRNDKTTEQADALPWSPRVRGIVSLLLAFHVAAVFIAPWSMPQPASALSQKGSGAIEPYLLALSINNVYRFFAPNPGPGHLVHYRLTLRDGSIKEGRFPDLEEHWPRQLYHRYFMIAETVDIATAGAFPPPAPPRENPNFPRMSPAEVERATAEFHAAGRRHEEVKKNLLQPIAQRLMREHDANAVELWCLQHEIPSREEFLSGTALPSEESFLNRPLGVYRRQ